MTQNILATQLRVGSFDTIQKADEAIRRLLAVGFEKGQLLVVCPEKYQGHFQIYAPKAESPAPDAANALAAGGAMGASLGGIALVATVLTGGAAGPAAVVLLGGGAIAGGLSSLIATKGYEEEVDDYYKKAVDQGHIIVGVEVPEGESNLPASDAERILKEAGAKDLNCA